MNRPTDTSRLVDLVQQYRAFHAEVCKDYRDCFEGHQSDFELLRSFARRATNEDPAPNAVWKKFERMRRLEIMLELLSALSTIVMAWIVLSKP